MDLRKFRRDVRSAREQRHWRQGDLADKVGVTRNTIYRLERGQHVPETATLVATADVLGLHLGDYDEDPVIRPVTRGSDAQAPLVEVPMTDDQRLSIYAIAGLLAEDTKGLHRDIVELLNARQATRRERRSQPEPD